MQAVITTAGQVRQVSGEVRLRPIALPIEHGGWSLLLEPVVLGLLLAPSTGGVLFALAALGAFLSRHPLKLVIADWVRKRRSPRTAMAVRFASLYIVLTVFFLLAAVTQATGQFWVPLLIAAPIFFVQLYLDSKGQSRALVAEVAGSFATGAFASVIAISGGWTIRVAFALWIISAARSVPTIFYLRARLRLLHSKPASPAIAYASHLLALVVVLVMALIGISPWLSVVAMAILMMRAVLGFRPSKQPVTAKMLGVRELIFGAVTVLMVVIGYRAGW
jgi:hypothetical protein